MPRLSILRVLTVLPWAFPLLTGLSVPARVLAESVIRGSAQNLSRSQPAAGDDILLFDWHRVPDAGTHSAAVAKTKTDAQGAFLLPVPHPGNVYLVRVLHQGIAYDQRGSAGDHLSISVFDAQPKVPAITGSIEILRLGTRMAANQKLLHVSDMYEIRNESSPPVTEAGDSTFAVYLPAEAKIDSVLAAGPSPQPEAGKTPSAEPVGLMISAAAVAGEPGHYRVNFPLRPGKTRFAFNYDLPYQGRSVFATRHQYAFKEFAVMMPPTMHFSSPSSAFHPLATGQSQYQVQAAIQLNAGPGPDFEVSGDGPPPSFPAKEQAQPHSPVLPSSASPRSTAPALGSASWPWLALAGGLILGCLLLLLWWRSHSLTAGQRASTALDGPQTASTSLENLKEELFQLELNRTRKSISNDEYSSARLALEESVKRVLRPNRGRAIVGARSRKTGKY